jgi:cytochrome d ubiquinol oxidase subunit I
MVGLGTFLFLLSLWFFASWVFKRRMPKSKLFLWIAAASGVLAVVTLEAGWVVTEVGRQPWIVRNYMKVEDAATANTGVWITFVAVLLVYLGLAVTLILVLRQMSRRWREGDAEAEVEEGGPYGPRLPPASEVPQAVVDREPVP